MMKDRHDAVIDERTVRLEILQCYSVASQDCFIAELSQVFVNIERNLKIQQSNIYRLFLNPITETIPIKVINVQIITYCRFLLLLILAQVSDIKY